MSWNWSILIWMMFKIFWITNFTLLPSICSIFYFNTNGSSGFSSSTWFLRFLEGFLDFSFSTFIRNFIGWCTLKNNLVILHIFWQCITYLFLDHSFRNICNKKSTLKLWRKNVVISSLWLWLFSPSSQPNASHGFNWF